MNKTRILIVEDEAIVALDIRRQLADLGYEPVAHTMQGEDAVTLVGQLRPDLVLMDIQLAGEMDGVATAQEIRQRYSIPVVFLTAFAGEETLKRAKLAEPYGYIIKPFEDRDLRTVIEMAIYKHQAEKELRECAAKFRSYIENAPIGILVTDREGRFTEMNPAALCMLGYSEEELLRLGVQDVQAISEAGNEMEFFKKLLEEHLVSGEKKLRRKDGAEFWTLISAVELNENRFMAFYRDITDRKRAEDEALYAASVLEAAFESTADALLMADRFGHFTHYNKQFASLWSFPGHILTSGDENAVIGSILDQVREPVAFRQRIQEIYAHPEDESFDEVELKNGRVLERYSKAHRIAGRPVGRVWSFRDVTERKRMEEQLRQAQKMEAIGQLAGGVAHDFNNILAAMLMQLGLLQGEAGVNDTIRVALKDMEVEAQRAAALTRQLLAFSRRQIIQIKPVNLDTLVKELFKMLRRVLGEHVVLEWNCNSPLPPLNADPGMIEQVIINLCVNARDAMPNGGNIRIEAQPVCIEEKEMATHPERRPGSYVRLSVADTGCGMDESVLQHIFEPFFTTKDVGRGTGLGLSTVYGIVKQHHGWIEVESVVNKGSAFHVYLRTIASIDGGEKNVKTLPVMEGRGETILVVEDEPSVRHLVCITLARRGYRVLKASSGPEALGLWKQYRADIDLLLTDVVMPQGMNGCELAETLRKEKPGLKVILSTGYSDKLIELSKQGAQTYFVLAKPYASFALLTAIRNAIDKT